VPRIFRKTGWPPYDPHRLAKSNWPDSVGALVDGCILGRCITDPVNYANHNLALPQSPDHRARYHHFAVAAHIQQIAADMRVVGPLSIHSLGSNTYCTEVQSAQV